MREGGQVDEDEGEGEEEYEGQASAAWHRPCGLFTMFSVGIKVKNDSFLDSEAGCADKTASWCVSFSL